MIETLTRTFYRFVDGLGFSHPIHAVLVHLPIGFIVGAFIFGSISFFSKHNRLALSARDCIILATLFYLPVVLFGFTDWVHYYGGAWLPAIKIKITLSGMLLLLLLATLYFELSSKKTLKWGLQLLYTCSLIMVVLIGWNGANLIYGTNPQLVLMPYKSGYDAFTTHCKSCHPEGGNIMDAQKPINNSPKLQDVNTFISFVRHSEGSMPSYPSTTISDHETEELYLYITREMNK
jgi:uncharacterized membrane protein